MDFYVYLPSNTDFLPENKSNNYVTKLAREISLEGEWECSLKEIHYPRTWASLFFHECSFVVEKEEWGNVWENRRIEAGHYLTQQDLINAINNAVQRDDVIFNFSETTQRAHMEIPAGCRLHFAEPLSSMLGLGYGNTVCSSITESGKFPIDLSRGIDSLYVYTDIVQTKLVGNTAVPLLRVVPVDGDYGTMVYKEYSSPVYSPLSKSTFNTIEVYIMDSAGRSIPFGYGKVTVLLHFKPRQ